jgi:hypothetical protein
MPAFTLQQKTFVFSMICNAAANMKGSVAQLQKAVKDRFTSVTSENTQFLGRGWTLEWGPVVQELGNSGVADNTVLVAKGTEGVNPVYVVAIAGTNAVSMFDIFTEDLEVSFLVPFGSTGARTSQGTRLGLDILEQLVFRRSVLANAETIQQYLTRVAATNATLIFTGHSLGGALAPSLALDLAANQGFDLSKWGAVYVYPSAGPTPGDAALAALFAQRFPPAGSGPTGSWNQNIENSIDVVPRAWNQLDKIQGIYNKDLPGTNCIGALVAALVAKRGVLNLNYANLPTVQFEGTYNDSVKGPTHPDDKSVQFAVQAFYQHIAAYVAALIPEFNSVFPPGSLPPSATDGIYNKCKTIP